MTLLNVSPCRLHRQLVDAAELGADTDVVLTLADQAIAAGHVDIAAKVGNLSLRIFSTILPRISITKGHKMTRYRLPDTLLRELIDATDDAEKIAHALEGIARYADTTHHGEIGDNLVILSDALRKTAATVESVAKECRRRHLDGGIGGVDA